MGEYDVMQVCKQGHKITERYATHPEHRQNYCEVCGSETITSCQECGASIRGNYDVDGVVAVGSDKDVPSYCHDCGESYPWIEG